jgi:hypothetical protein
MARVATRPNETLAHGLRERPLSLALTGLAVGVAVAAAFSLNAEKQTFANVRGEEHFGADEGEHGEEGSPGAGEPPAPSGIAQELTARAGTAGVASNGDVLHEAGQPFADSEMFEEAASTPSMTAGKEGGDRNEQRARRIRERAERIWLDEGCPEGRAEAHWELASKQIALEEGD